MSETVIGVAVFKSVCPGTARTMRAESAKVTDWSVPLSVASTTELPATDLTVPTALTTGVWAEAATINASAAIATLTTPRKPDFFTTYFMTIYYQLNHAIRR